MLIERPILMSAPTVRALQSGTTTQTRRALKAQPPEDTGDIRCGHYNPTIVRRGEEEPGEETFGAYSSDGIWALRCPYGQPGDRLWVREPWAHDDEDGALMYRADLGLGGDADEWERNRLEGTPRYRWRSSIHMPRWASRITLEITDVRVQRLQEISVADAMADVVVETNKNLRGMEPCMEWIYAYEDLWESIHGPGSWDANPWVWAISFRRIAT